MHSGPVVQMTLWYLATPYTKYYLGIDAAFDLACEQAGILARAGVRVFSPIVHTHLIARASGIDPLDPAWVKFDHPMMKASTGLIVVLAEGWDSSSGIAIEREQFREDCKREVFMHPGFVPPDVMFGNWRWDDGQKA